MDHIDYWRKIKNQFQDKKHIIFLGEFHGAKINSAVMDKFVNELDIDVIMVELEAKWKKSFSYLKKGQEGKFIKSFKKEDWIFQSGLIGNEYIKLFSKYLKNGKKIIPIKVENQDWNISETKTGENIKKFLKTNQNKNVLVIMGRLHMRKKPFYFNLSGKSKRLIPMGFHFNKSSISVQMRYCYGEAYNFRKIKINDRVALKCPSKKSYLIRSRSQYFNYDFIIPNTEAINPIKIN